MAVRGKRQQSRLRSGIIAMSAPIATFIYRFLIFSPKPMIFIYFYDKLGSLLYGIVKVIIWNR